MIDEIKNSAGASATVFVKDGADFIRVSTNVLTPEGRRGLRSTLATARAQEAVSKGESWCGHLPIGRDLSRAAGSPPG